MCCLTARASDRRFPNGLTVEYIAWSIPLWEEIPEMEKGDLVVPDKPGLGLKFNQDIIRKYGV